ncbi:hypothetical protein ACO22_00407 [Paracoccidioides brasiliensis]|uniref:Uncharacterized protein n=1 Tax=Paracoccidioides brasiliensis TaxID=121759 RepID=A0A1D2JPK0_PARBR|nr:hypothetical protein ACO22_00407 [Paracoccidioides brasiliensis]
MVVIKCEAVPDGSVTQQVMAAIVLAKKGERLENDEVQACLCTRQQASDVKTSYQLQWEPIPDSSGVELLGSTRRRPVPKLRMHVTGRMHKATKLRQASMAISLLMPQLPPGISVGGCLHLHKGLEMIIKASKNVGIIVAMETHPQSQQCSQHKC